MKEKSVMRLDISRSLGWCVASLSFQLPMPSSQRLRGSVWIRSVHVDFGEENIQTAPARCVALSGDDRAFFLMAAVPVGSAQAPICVFEARHRKINILIAVSAALPLRDKSLRQDRQRVR
jgi:hypothetical protein